MKAIDQEKVEKHINQILTNVSSAKKLCDPQDTTPFNEAIKTLHIFLTNIATECEKILE